ncbi:glycoside hydrolase family 2 TIM barrel-domain containing protein [Echinicola vietnamensis]|uniref:beta-galactosidase n=1 Tax=Echinicola vietnamensis (strain DSM 17526 / LMG 23754 / KMM 6221) TaxID=926556 RepID=L0FXB4_ECHVK|nr:glycoside hydrolase family 2 TIM barrel-domain containing protein [Echinicola vietnamensis]AGA77947.1 beta-galactosidase/beta-glucuronidase [Echinicola vietnamensis DSM 17526]
MIRSKRINRLFLGLASVFVVWGVKAQETEIQYLSGKGYQDTKEWEFKISGGRKSGEWSTISVPSVWEQEGFGKYQYGIKFYGKPFPDGIADEVGQYKYTFEVPKAWENKLVRIVFDGSMTDTEVRVNGRSAGDKHQGAFYRFKYDITDLLKYGKENLLEVTVSKESSNASVNLAERRADYWNFGGIFRPVFLEAFPAKFIDRTAIDAQANGQFRAEVFLGHASADDMKVVATVKDEEGQSLGQPMEQSITAGGDKVVLESAFEGVDLWTAETPSLYHIQFSLYDGDELVHQVDDRFGFRTIELKESDGIYINGQRVLMKGVNKHSFWPESGRTLNKELNYADAKLIKEMNMNAVRLSHYPSDPEFLDACDELGLYVLHELGGWHGHYDEAIGMELVESLVTRDVNHPSVIFWDNGNEGGWNTELDDEFAKWDPQNRPVLHPQQLLNGVETMHYRSYGETEEYFRGDYIFMPTEFLHGLYDGGHGAGLYDYWELMRTHPRSGGGFLWVFADEGIARTDQDGRIDNQGNYGADGIVGPHHEKEGSFFTIKEVWSPVMVMQEDELSPDFDGTFPVENRYDFTNLDACTFEWSLGAFYGPETGESGHKVIKSGELNGPDVAPHESGEITLPLPADWEAADVLYLTAKDPSGKELWTWHFTWEQPTQYLQAGNGSVELEEQQSDYVVSSGDLKVTFSKENGQIVAVKEGGSTISFGGGPRFVAARRGDRTLDGTVDPDFEKGMDRIYKALDLEQELRAITAEEKDGQVTVKASYFGPLEEVVWTIQPGGLVQLDYTYRYNGVVELMGVSFDYPEEKVKAIRWLGEGPYRSWQNRIHGTTLDIWGNDYNDPIPGESFTYPEFKGYFHDWHWAAFETEEGKIYMANDRPDNYLGVYTPRDGRDALLYTLPQTGLAVFDVIPGVRNKVNATDLVGPSSQPQHVSGKKEGRVYFKFKAH